LTLEHLSLLVDPVELAVLVADDLTLLEPESDFLLGVLDAVGTVADVAADVLFIMLVEVGQREGKPLTMA
jgi:hypothetical protein